MKLNFRRGFFRIWIAVAILWIFPALILNSKDLGLTAQPESGPTVTVNDRKHDLFEAQGPDGQTYRIEASDADSARLAIDEFFGLLGGGHVPPPNDAGGFYAWPTNGTRIWAVERHPRKPSLMKFEVTEPNGTVHFVEASSWIEADAAVVEMRASGGHAPQGEQAAGSSEPIFFSPFVLPTNGARVWAVSSRFDDFPTAQEERTARHLLTPSEQQAALRSARNRSSRHRLHSTTRPARKSIQKYIPGRMPPS
jgi:hypothetical protein